MPRQASKTAAKAQAAHTKRTQDTVRIMKKRAAQLKRSAELNYRLYMENKTAAEKHLEIHQASTEEMNAQLAAIQVAEDRLKSMRAMNRKSKSKGRKASKKKSKRSKSRR